MMCKDLEPVNGEILRDITVSICPSPKEMAVVFSQWDDEEQAAFFSALAKQVAKDWDNPFYQLQAISERENLTAGGREIMRLLGNTANQESEASE